VLVIDVPILAPIITGIAWLTVIILAPTIDTIILVEVLELCTKTVTITPITRPVTGFCRTYLLDKNSEAFLPFIKFKNGFSQLKCKVTG